MAKLDVQKIIVLGLAAAFIFALVAVIWAKSNGFTEISELSIQDLQNPFVLLLGGAVIIALARFVLGNFTRRALGQVVATLVVVWAAVAYLLPKIGINLIQVAAVIVP